MNFGRRIPGEKKAEEKVVKEVTSNHILREINLFIPEIIALIVSLLASAFLLYFTRYLLLSGLESVKEQMMEETYNSLASTMNTANALYVLPALVPLGFFAIFFLYRYFTFMPHGDKYLFVRIKESGAIRLSIQKLLPEIAFSNSVDSIKMKILNPRKHWNEVTGKPIIVLREGDDSNANLNENKGSFSEKGVATSVVNDNAIAIGRRLERYMQEKKDGFLNTTNILLIIVLAIAAIGTLKQLGVLG